jgi:hypothetical protein
LAGIGKGEETMKNPKIPLPIVVAVVLWTTLAFYASFPWARELTGGRDAWQEIRRYLPSRVYRLFHPPRPVNPTPRVVVVRTDPDNLVFPPSMAKYVDEFRRQRGLSDANDRIIGGGQFRLRAIPRSQREAFGEFMRQRALSDPNLQGRPAPPPDRQNGNEDPNDPPAPLRQ